MLGGGVARGGLAARAPWRGTGCRRSGACSAGAGAGGPRGGGRAGGRPLSSPRRSSPDRTRNLLRIGVIEKPLWFDVYAAFPPLREPVYRVPRPRYGKVRDVVPPVFYPEDEVRA